MQQKATLYGIIGLLAGILLTIIFTSSIVNSNNTGMMKIMGMHTVNKTQTVEDDEAHMMPDGSMMENMDDDMTMNDMVNNLKGKSGDEFDKAFLLGMIEHHQGAIEMANLALQNAGHEEIKTMAEDIISAQANEINMMQEWQNSWGF